MTPIVSTVSFKRLPSPSAIMPMINRDHRGARLLAHMCARYPHFFRRPELMEAGGFTVSACGGPLCAATSFEYTIMRVNDRLPRTGWRINEIAGVYKLELISGEQAARLIARLGAAA